MPCLGRGMALLYPIFFYRPVVIRGSAYIYCCRVPTITGKKSSHTVTDSAHNCLNQRSQLTGWTERAEIWLGESKELRKNPPRRKSPRQKRRLMITKICAKVKKRIVTSLMRLTRSWAGRGSILVLLLRKMATNMDTPCTRRSRSRMDLSTSRTSPPSRDFARFVRHVTSYHFSWLCRL